MVLFLIFVLAILLIVAGYLTVELFILYCKKIHNEGIIEGLKRAQKIHNDIWNKK